MMNGAKAIAKKYNEISLILRIVVGLVIGAVLALAVPGAGWVGELGSLFVGALKGIAPVLVFVIGGLIMLVAGFTYVKDYNRARAMEA